MKNWNYLMALLAAIGLVVATGPVAVGQYEDPGFEREALGNEVGYDATDEDWYEDDSWYADYEEEWYDPEGWFDGNDYDYDDTFGDYAGGFDKDAYGDDDWYYDYYDEEFDYGYNGDYYETNYEFEPAEGYHEEEWYDPSDWLDLETGGVDYEED